MGFSVVSKWFEICSLNGLFFITFDLNLDKMATLQFMKNGTDLTNEVVTDKYDKSIRDGLSNLFTEHKGIFNGFSGVFSIQLSHDRIFYTYLGNDATYQNLQAPRQLIDDLIDKTNRVHALGHL